MHRPLTDAERVLDALRLESSMPLGRLPQEPAATPTLRLAVATVAWLGWVFALCYVVLPLASVLLGVRATGLDGLLPSLLAWAGAAVVVASGILVCQPVVSKDGRRDPVVAAVLGGLVVWALAENVLPIFRPFGAFGWVDLAWFMSQNVIEMGLLGAVWGSFARRPHTAFALGAAFQLLVIGISAVFHAG